MEPPDSPSVLIVDDEPAVRGIMARWAASLGLSARTAASADEALRTLGEDQCELAVIDIMMPGRDGLWLATELQRAHPHTAVVLATAHTALLDGESARRRPIADLLIKPFARDRFVLAVDRGRRWRRDSLSERRWHASLTVEVRDRTEALCTELAHRAGNGADDASVLAALVAERAADLLAHSDRVARYALAVAREVGVDPAGFPHLEQAARFHDVGKLTMPDALLTKPSPLTASEQSIMRWHVNAGAEILFSSRALAEVAPTVLASHEWYGGAGYPHRLAGAAIPLFSRIIAVVDAYDAMTQDRYYRSRLDSAEAVSELLRCAPVQFDPDIVVRFLSVLARH